MRTPVLRCGCAMLVALVAWGGGIRPAVDLRAAQGRALQIPRLDSTWLQLRTPEFTVMGNALERDLREVFSGMLEFRSSFAMLFPGARLDSSTPTTIVVLKDLNAFSRFQPRDSNGRRGNVGGFARMGALDNLMVYPLSSRDLEVVFHEYAHYLVNLNTSYVPTWLSEGLADFFSTFRPQYQGASLLGNAPADRLRSLRQGTFMPLREVVSPRDFDKMWRTGDRIFMFYAESWAFVHYILVERKAPKPAPFSLYLKAIARGSTVDDAFVEAFGADLDTIEKELKDYVRRLRFNAFRVPQSGGAAMARVALEHAPEADVRTMQGRLLAQVGENDEAEQELKIALTVEPRHVNAQIWLAAVRSAQERPDDALSILTAARNANPSHLGAIYSLGATLADAWNFEAALEAFTRAVTVDPRHAWSWLGLSGAAAALGRDAQARATFIQAQQLENDPQLYRSYLTTALRVGRAALAAEAAHAYLDRVGFAEQGAQYVAFEGAIAHWRANQAPEAEALLTAAGAAIPERTWTWSVLQFLQNRLDAEKLLAAAKTIGERTEAHAYIGFKLDIAGQTEEAMTHFNWVVDQGAKNYTEYGLVKDELARLKHLAEVAHDPSR